MSSVLITITTGLGSFIQIVARPLHIRVIPASVFTSAACAVISALSNQVGQPRGWLGVCFTLDPLVDVNLRLPSVGSVDVVTVTDCNLELNADWAVIGTHLISMNLRRFDA